MTKNRNKLAHAVRYGIVLLLVAVVAALGMPLRAFSVGSRSASAEAVTGEAHDSDPVVTASATLVDVKLTVNYYRKNGDYDGYNMWIWELPNGEGADYPHNFDAGTVEMTGFAGKEWKTMTVTVHNVNPSAANIIGVIVRKPSGTNEWAWQTANLSVSGSALKQEGGAYSAEVFLLQGEGKAVTVHYSAEEAMSKKITDAYFASFTSVRITTSAAITEKSVFKIKDGDDNVIGTLDCSVSDAAVGKTSANIPLDGEAKVDFGKTYKVVDEPETFDSGENFSPKAVDTFKLYDTKTFEEEYSYKGTLGADYSAARTVFTVWSPVATSMKVNIYADSKVSTPLASYDMTHPENGKGVWQYTLDGDQNGKYYTYTINDETEIVDPYARSGGANGVRGMILDLDSTDPEGWNDPSLHRIPDYGTTEKAISKAVIWEAQIRDLTIHESSGVSEAHRGKYLGLTEVGTTNGAGKHTALSYLKDLGITQIHLQPFFDFASVRETFEKATYNGAGEYNWGYDPLNYNMPEGSYSTDPTDGYTRVNELKQMIMALHNAGIQVIMDVVYNHVSDAGNSNFEKLMPGYFFRMTESGTYYNGSGCGNDTASERPMFRKFMIDSVKYWMEEYKIDGFRFDLMGLHDIDTMNAIYDTLSAINRDVIVYGEGWKMSSGLADENAANMFNAFKMPHIAFFNDTVRDGLKGSVFNSSDTGYVSGKTGNAAAVYVAAGGATSAIPDKYYKMLGSDKAYFTISPVQNINYASAHDNAALWDRLNASVNGGPHRAGRKLYARRRGNAAQQAHDGDKRLRQQSGAVQNG